MRRSDRIFQVGVGLLLTGALAQAASVVPRVARLASTVPTAAVWVVGAYVATAVTAVLACALGFFLLVKAAGNPAARALTLFLAFLAVFWGSLFRFVEIGSDVDSVSVGLTYGSGWGSQSALAAILLAVSAFLRFTALFPRPLTADRLPPARFGWLRRLRALSLRPVPVWGTAAGLFLVMRAVPAVVEALIGEPPWNEAQIGRLIMANVIVSGVGYILVPAAAVGFGILNLRTAYRLADPPERRRMTWVRVGFSSAAWLVVAAVGVSIVVGTFDLPDRFAIVIPAFFVLAPLLIVLGSAAGTLYSGAIDPAIALQRSQVFGLLAALAVVGFAALENGLSALVETRLGLPGFAGSMAAGGIVAVCLLPMRRPLQRLVRDRLARLAGSDSVGTSPD